MTRPDLAALVINATVLAACIAMTLAAAHDSNPLAIAGWATASIFHTIHAIADHTRPKDDQ